MKLSHELRLWLAEVLLDFAARLAPPTPGGTRLVRHVARYCAEAVRSERHGRRTTAGES